MGLTVISTLVVIGVLVFVHELGHFLAAKWAGIYVHRFSLGLGAPVKWLSFRRGETEYSVSWLPLGGYVKMASTLEEGAGASLEGGVESGVEVPPNRMFESKPVWVRMIVILAGVVMNSAFAWLLLAGILYVNGVQVTPVTAIGSVDSAGLPPGAKALATLSLGDTIVSVDGARVTSWEAYLRRVVEPAGDSVRIGLASGRTVSIAAGSVDDRRATARSIRPLLPPVISEVVAGRPGAKAGLAVGDTVLAFDGTPVAQWQDMVSQIESRGDQGTDVLVGRPAGRLTIRATPALEQVKDSVTGTTRTVGRLGIAGPALPEAREPVALGAAFLQGGRQTWFVATRIVSTVQGLFAGRISTREVGGPISIGIAAGQSVRRGGEDFLFFMALISVNLAVINLLPIPILDGGQFLFLLAEGVMRRPVTGRIREWLTMAGLVAIGMLMVLAFSNDIRRLLGF